MRPVISEEAPATGEIIDTRYRLESTLGRGGMARVHQATDMVLDRTVALKIFVTGDEPGSEVQRTLVEVRALARLSHHALVTLYDASVDEDGATYLVMECIDGPTLRERILQGRIPEAEVAEMASDLGEALHVVHEAGIVHRDVKPSNVLLKPNPVSEGGYRAKLADFGIAYLIDSARVTRPGSLIGTAAYLSPEQVKGAPPAPASDVYALGLVLLESLTGRRVYPETSTHQSLLARLNRDPDVPAALGDEWCALLTAMTAKDPTHRPTALQVAVAARRIRSRLEPDADGRTKVMPEQEPTPTIVLSASRAVSPLDVPTQEISRHEMSRETTFERIVAPLREEDGAVSPADGTPVPPARPGWSRRVPWIVVIAVLVIVALAIGLLVWILLPHGTPHASLPSLPDPIGTHLQELYDEVSR